ncbi:MAG: transposase [Chloroflexi bacterium]|nr:transposase [Chloroflexota bacterium]
MKTTWFAHWRKVGSQAVQAICERHEQVYDNFFNHQGGLPRFRKAQKYTSFTLKQAGWTLRKAEAGKRYHRITIDGTVYKFVFIDRFERTTGKCSGCGHEQAVTLAERIFVCESCGLALGRDHNAALNILEAGRRLILSQSEEDPVYNGASGAHGSFSHP